MAEIRNTLPLKYTIFSKMTLSQCLYLVLFIFFCAILNVSCKEECKVPCENGICTENNTKCECFDGWAPPSCSHCLGRMRLTGQEGVVTEGSGNYSTDKKCMWLLEPDTPGPLRLSTHQFATECGWDHLYVFDGDSIFSPLIAAYSGLVQQTLDLNSSLTEIVANSGKAYIYFYSDAAYNMSGFHIKYKVGECGQNCSDHGYCNNSTCLCDPGYMGDFCQWDVCPSNCSSHGTCNKATLTCDCDTGYKGLDCSITSSAESWVRYPIHNPPVGRASAASVLINDELVVSGGYAFGAAVDFLVMYNITSREWATVTPLSTDNPKYLYGHTMVLHKDTLYIFGGVSGQHIESRLWMYNITQELWSFKDFNTTEAVAGHSAVVVDNVMYLIFGHSPIYGYMNRVQQMQLDASNLTLTTVETKGAVIRGGYGHSSVYHEVLREIFVHGGYISGVQTTQHSLTDNLYSFNVDTKIWTILAHSGLPRYLHSAVFLGELMVVFGGNTHNDTSISFGAKCYSPDFIAYDRHCNSWMKLDNIDLLPDAARYGHVAQAVTSGSGLGKMLVFGGFDGTMLQDVLEYEPGECSYYNNGTCNVQPGRVCVCTDQGSMDRSEAMTNGVAYTPPSECKPSEGAEAFCPSQHASCGSCLSSLHNCKWCDNKCSTNCSADDKVITDPAQCSTLNASENNEIMPRCSLRHNCHYCTLDPKCAWSPKEGCREREMTDFLLKLTENDIDKTATKQQTCDPPCYTFNSCENCTAKTCMWCGSQERCVETNSYVASFLYGQCLEWVTSSKKCPATRCSDLPTCEECKSHPACGWCNDVSNTGLGKCIQGSEGGPVSFNSSTGEHTPDPDQCPAKRWHFVTCPPCQCNGHSTCSNVTDQCDQCQNLTEGTHCERCQDGFHGNPRNGGNCTACSCNGQADSCDHESGKCFCRTRGIKGDNCNVCDVDNNYKGNPKNGGTCYYNLRTDYQFTFNLSKAEDKHHTSINFMNIPVANDRDVDFTLNCSGTAFINITWKSKSHPQEEFKTREYLCTYFRSKFEHKDYNFGPEDNVTFFVYVYGFETPFLLQISFSQFPKIDLVHFFVTFFSCFLSLLIIAAILYKIKHKYDNYRRRQRIIVELEEMASRPFAITNLEFEVREDQSGADKKDTNPDLRKRKRSSHKPMPIAQEALCNQKAAVFSVFVQLPCGDELWAPSGQSGLAIGSALVSIGHQRKQSVEYSQKDRSKHHHHKKHAFMGVHDTHV